MKSNRNGNKMHDDCSPGKRAAAAVAAAVAVDAVDTSRMAMEREGEKMGEPC